MQKEQLNFLNLHKIKFIRDDSVNNFTTLFYLINMHNFSAIHTPLANKFFFYVPVYGSNRL